MTSSPAKQRWLGHAMYSRPMLAAYDWEVLGFENRVFWRCPAREIQAWCDQHVSGNHLDVGVGTGYFLDHCRSPCAKPRLGLLDINPNCLRKASARLARYQPEVYRADVLQPIRLDAAPFDSVSCNYLLHCLPGSIRDKAVIFDYLRPLMSPDATLFGATLLHRGGSRSRLARAVMALYNALGILTNTADDLDGLKESLTRRFAESAVRMVGCVALFWGRT